MMSVDHVLDALCRPSTSADPVLAADFLQFIAERLPARDYAVAAGKLRAAFMPTCLARAAASDAAIVTTADGAED